MKKLLKQHGLQTICDYHTMVLNAYDNGNRKDAKEYFMAMPKKERIEFLKHIIFECFGGKPLAGSIMFFNAMFNL